MYLVARFFAIILFLSTFSLCQSSDPQSPPPEPQKDTQAPRAPVRISRREAEKHLVKPVIPRYPEEAKNMHVSGMVVLRILISRTGDVEDIRRVIGHPLLVPACIDAVKRSKYKPFVVNGELVEVDTTVEHSFELSGGL